MPRLILFLPLLLAACAAAPGADFPQLVPAGPLLAEAPLTPSPAPGLEGRAAALRARAEALRQANP